MRKGLILKGIFFILFSGNLLYAKTLKITTGFTVLQDILQNIVQDKAKVTNLVGYDQDPHGFELKPQDMALVQSSDLVLINGLGLESWAKVVEKDKLVVVNNGVKSISYEGKIDPHTWQDPEIVQNFYIPNILKKLVKTDPDNADFYKDNADKYMQQLKQLNKTTFKKLAFISPEQRYIVTTHDAFGYFGKRYGLHFLSLQGVSTDSEPAAKDMAKLESYIKSSTTKIVFLENMSNSNLMKQITKDTGAVIGGKLYADGLSKDEVANSYIKMIAANTDTIIAAYQNSDNFKHK